MKINKTILLASVILSIVTFIGVGTLASGYDKNLSYNYNENSGDLVKNNLILVNKENSLKIEYNLEDMIKPKIRFLDSSTEEEMHMQVEASKAIEELFEVARNEGITLIGTSAYRSHKTQKKIYRENIDIRGREEAKNYAALPGKSEHQTGLAIDVTNEERWFDKSTKEAMWISENAHRFGFILRYLEGKEDITGYNFEPWHIRYVGKTAAKEIYEKELTLEEYLEIN